MVLPQVELAALLAAMPKAELHVHIEGTLEPELIFALAQRKLTSTMSLVTSGAARSAAVAARSMTPTAETSASTR